MKTLRTNRIGRIPIICPRCKGLRIVSITQRNATKKDYCRPCYKKIYEFPSRRISRSAQILGIKISDLKESNNFLYWLEVHALYMDIKNFIKEVQNGSSKIRKVPRSQGSTQRGV